ncbi:MAG: hypothetical protein ACFB51_00250, partial [Anaerolineae bacterium]
GESRILDFDRSLGAIVGASLPGCGSAAPPCSRQPPAAPAGAAPGGASYQPAPPPAPGPVAREEESEGPDVNRLIVIGCGALTLIFCCLLVGGAIAVDQLNLYCDLPFASQLFGANCPPIP